MSHKRLKVKSRELLLANSNHLCLVIAVIIAFTLGVMPLIALYLVGDVITEGVFYVIFLATVALLFIPLITGIYRMAGLAHEHKAYGIIDIFYAFSSVENYIRVLLVNLFCLIKLLIPIMAGVVWFAIISLILKNVVGSVWIAAVSAVLVGASTLPLTKRFYAVSFFTLVEEKNFLNAIKLSAHYTKGRAIRLTLVTLKFLPVTILSIIALMVPFVIYNFPFIICLYSVVCGELKREHERENDKIEIMNDKCPKAYAEGVEEINEQHS